MFMYFYFFLFFLIASLNLIPKDKQHRKKPIYTIVNYLLAADRQLDYIYLLLLGGDFVTLLVFSSMLMHVCLRKNIMTVITAIFH
jgi:hypothetical protein